ncbi:MAG: hypothetical protein DMG97_24135 [Acidobacteria bacterium]|nr:MAG: hypothetical protein DMG97_24135 [Acidobacteriota bacterium]
MMHAILTRPVPSEKPSASQPVQGAGAMAFSTTEWLTASEAAAYLRVKVRTLLLWARQGKVKAYALSGTKRHVWRFRASDLDAMLVGPSVPCSKGAQ